MRNVHTRGVYKKKIMRYLAVKYRNGVADIVPGSLLDQLIATGSIQQFYRPSEQR